MKNYLLFLICLFSFSSSFAQNSIEFNIHHKLGVDDFALNAPVVNNLGNDFSLSRLQYYVSEIAIIHDGGMETLIPNTWLLVNAADVLTTVDLGAYAINQVEGVSFHIGVGPDHNHLDPSTYASGHPLAPQLPSMHWGWASGYRFVCLEGVSGPALNQSAELHAVGDAVYYKTELSLSATPNNNVISIDIIGDYIRTLENLDVSTGIFYHGEYPETRNMLTNFRDLVFSTMTTTGTTNLYQVNQMDIFPNPSTDGTATLVISAEINFTGELAVFDAFGRKIQELNTITNDTPVELKLASSGLYFVSLMKNGQMLMTKQFVVK